MTETMEAGNSAAARADRAPPRVDAGQGDDEDLDQLRGLAYLILDDSRFARTLVKNVLHALGLRNLTECESAEQALQLVKSTKIDVIFADFEMPDMNGAKFTWHLRRSKDEQVQRIPVIMVSSHADDSHVRLAINSGVNEYLPKPFAPKELRLRLRRSVLAPKPFIVAPGYIGPDRRLPDGEARNGVERRGGVAAPALLLDFTGPEPTQREIARPGMAMAPKEDAAGTKPEANPESKPEAAFSAMSESGPSGLAAAVRERIEKSGQAK